MLVVVGVIFPSEDHLGFVDRENAVVRNGYAVRVTPYYSEMRLEHAAL